MSTPVRVLGAIAVFVVLVLVLGAITQALGRYVAANPDKSTLVWTLWNGILIVVSVAGLFVVWRRYRTRTQQPDA
jgi:cytochrome c-type biogenesis protein CcmH/NrfF